jgi:biopolymer transport protein ExbD
MRRRRRHYQDDDSQHVIDLAPMLDFVLNLLIFFIITAIFVKEFGLELNRPSGVEQSASDAKGISVSVLSNDEIWIDGRVVDVRAVRANIERLHAANPQGGVLLVADAEARSGLVIETADQIRLAGIFNITFTTTD